MFWKKDYRKYTKKSNFIFCFEIESSFMEILEKKKGQGAS